MLPDLKLIIDLQDLDNQISELTTEIKRLPLHIAEIEKALESHNRRLEADKAALAANQKERKRLEGDIQVHEQKISKLKEQMMSAKTNEQYRAFQHEIAFFENEVRKAEDRILDLMAASEPLEKNVAAAEAALADERKVVEAEKSSARRRSAEDEKALAENRKRREQIVASLDKRVYSYYSRVQTRHHGAAVADASEGHCSACHLALRPQFFQDLKRSDAVMHCESCGRILYYRPPETTVVVDDLASAPNPFPIRKV